MANNKQHLVLSILDFLSESMNDGTVEDEDKEGLEVAAQSIGESFGVDPTEELQRRLSDQCYGYGTCSHGYDLCISSLQKCLQWDYWSIHSAPPDVQALLMLTVLNFKQLYVTRLMFPEYGNSTFTEVGCSYQAQLAYKKAQASLNWENDLFDIGFKGLGTFLSRECAPWRKFAIDAIGSRVMPLFELDKFDSPLARQRAASTLAHNGTFLWRHVGLDKNGQLQHLQHGGNTIWDLDNFFYHPSIALAVVYLFCEGDTAIYNKQTYPLSSDAFDHQAGTEYNVFIHTIGFACVAIQYGLNCEAHPPNEPPEFGTAYYNEQYSFFMRSISTITTTNYFSEIRNNIYTLAFQELRLSDPWPNDNRSDPLWMSNPWQR